jgi:hypothetical protein
MVQSSAATSGTRTARRTTLAPKDNATALAEEEEYEEYNAKVLACAGTCVEYCGCATNLKK